MSVPSTADELLALIRKSGMVDEPRLAAYLQGRSGANDLPPDATTCALEFVRDGLLTDFQREQFLLGKWRGFTIGKYKLLERIGVGGMGQVFLCEHLFMKRRVAIKVLPPAKSENPGALGRFYREARAAGSLEHPHIVRTHDIDQDGNLHFIVMEYVDGANLLEIVRKFGPMDIHRAVHYIRQVAVGLDYAFRSGIIHRDVKPGNVLIDRRGHAKILDMGLAKFYKDTSDMLTVKYDDKVVLGTADYVAPEQVANSHSVDVRADVYALGASFYFLLAGHPPFPQGTVSQKLIWHRTKDPVPLRQVRTEVPEGLWSIIKKMMSKDPNQRYQSPADVVVELDRWMPAAYQIPMPAPEEMPRLSPAALAGAPAEGEESGQYSGVGLGQGGSLSGGMPYPGDGSGILAMPTPSASGAMNSTSAVRFFPTAGASPVAAPAASPFGPAGAVASPPGAATWGTVGTSASPFGVQPGTLGMPAMATAPAPDPTLRPPAHAPATVSAPAKPPYVTYIALVVVSMALAVGATLHFSGALQPAPAGK